MVFQRIQLFGQQKKLKQAQQEATARLVEERLSCLKEHYTVHMIEIDRICPPEEGRSAANQRELKELCDSIRRYGLLAPLTVRRICPDHSSLGGIFALVDGSRRFEAVKSLGMRTVPCVICQLNAPDLAPALCSSLLRTKSPSPFQIAALIEDLRQERCLNDQQIGALLSIEEQKVAEYRRLLIMEEDERTLALSAELPFYLLTKLSTIHPQNQRKRWLVETVHTLRTLFPEDQLSTPAASAPARRMLFSDVRPFFNSIEQMIRRMRDAGITATGCQSEDEECYEFTLRIKKESTVRVMCNSNDHTKAG